MASGCSGGRIDFTIRFLGFKFVSQVEGILQSSLTVPTVQRLLKLTQQPTDGLGQVKGTK